MNDDSARRAELVGLLRACRARLARPPVPGTRRSGMRQEDIAGIAGISVRVYGDFERGAYVPNAQVVDQIASALQMSAAERSALHVLATGQDPPRPLARAEHSLPGEQVQALRDLVSQSELPRVFRTGNLRLNHAASCPFRYSSKTSCGVR